MVSLQTFSDAGTPLFEDFGTVAPQLTDATRTLTPFSEALTVSLKSLGNAAEASGPNFAKADPVVRQASVLAKSGVVPTEELAKLLVDLKKTGGWDGLTELIYNNTAALNGFDQYGHFGRTRVTLSTCLEYETKPSGYSGCVANFNGPNASGEAETSGAALFRLLAQQSARLNGGALAEQGPAIGIGQSDSTSPESEAEEGEAEVAEASETGSGTKPLLDYLLGP
jgi:hypothetical protein